MKKKLVFNFLGGVACALCIAFLSGCECTTVDCSASNFFRLILEDENGISLFSEKNRIYHPDSIRLRHSTGGEYMKNVFGDSYSFVTFQYLTDLIPDTTFIILNSVEEDTIIFNKRIQDGGLCCGEVIELEVEFINGEFQESEVGIVRLIK